MQPGTRHTLSYLRNLFDERGIRIKNRLGQNFLIDLNLLDVLLRAAELTEADLVLEVGSGTGNLTVRSPRRPAPWSASRSTRISPASPMRWSPAATASCYSRPTFLKNKNEINPLVLEAVRNLQARSDTPRIKLVANLPYGVATPVIANLLLSDLNVERMVVTVQWEIAERLLAVAGRQGVCGAGGTGTKSGGCDPAAPVAADGLFSRAAGRFGVRVDSSQSD